MEVVTIFFKMLSRRLPGDVLKKFSKRRLQDIFYDASSRRLPRDILKTSLTRLKTSSRFFLVNAKDLPETIYELSILARFKLLTYYHSITKQTNWIKLNKLNTLKHGNNAEVMKTWFSMNCQSKKHFFQNIKYILASDFCIQQLY